MSASPSLSLPRFEGPLDLLLELVRKHQVPITEIPIAEVTRQYLEYLSQAEQMNLELGSEFALMAATLIQIKARTLLPADPELASREPDPRQELIRQLLDHEQIRKAAEFLQQRLELKGATWSRSGGEEFGDFHPEEELPVNPESMNLAEILRLAHRALEVARSHQWLHLSADPVTVEQMIRWLESRITALRQGEGLVADPLFAEQQTAERKTTLFLAILEMSKSARLRVEQKGIFQPISLVRCGEQPGGSAR